MKTKYLSKSPGNDLLTKCFYKIFWKELKDLYIMSIKQTFHKKKNLTTSKTILYVKEVDQYPI